MTKEEYEDFALRYKGCGACFPMYHTLSRFEKRWFTAIQKDVADLEKENAELKAVERMALYSKMSDQLTKAKEIIENLLYYVKQCTCERSNYAEIEEDTKEAEQFLKDSEVEK